MIKTYEILEQGLPFVTVRARSAENALKRAKREVTLRACDYNLSPGETVELEWCAIAADGEKAFTRFDLTA